MNGNNQLIGWVPVEIALPQPWQTVWITNGDWVALGCRSDADEDAAWCWAQSNGTIYSEDGCIVSECESDDLDVVYWHPLPKLPEVVRPVAPSDDHGALLALYQDLKRMQELHFLSADSKVGVGMAIKQLEIYMQPTNNLTTENT